MGLFVHQGKQVANYDNNLCNSPLLEPSLLEVNTTTEKIMLCVSQKMFKRYKIRPIDYFFVPPVYQPPNGQGPIVNLIHRLGYKISNTADFLAEMLRGTVKTFT
ncbi:hypothetical protein Bhyg_10744 [Pseudolycoriella hygida]|uniref:Uncharacterized protein n=1 Tax=Pseudolycoriella hygida TaxID=35572 RepID=A0A9Q0RYZ6_9DIPT|nr:hypothetical protein Bhyg_10744 [Pseudolycoriella hygida]